MKTVQLSIAELAARLGVDTKRVSLRIAHSDQRGHLIEALIDGVDLSNYQEQILCAYISEKTGVPSHIVQAGQA